MDNLKNILTRDEVAVFTLRSLFNEYGYSRYKMSKFEEYDFYVKNKDFLTTDNIITFTDTDGRLLALKPDVTISIIKSTKESKEGIIKAQYNESVYRVSKNTNCFKELMQVGLECMGAVGNKELTEVIYLAGRSLDLLAESNILEISHLDVTYGVLRYSGISDEGKRKVLECLVKKNFAGVEAACTEDGLDAEKTALVKSLATVYGTPDKVLPKLDVFKVNEETVSAVEQLKEIFESLKSFGVSDSKLYVDFSLVGNMKYYNGIAMRGFINGTPNGILLGGQYDNMMRKMGRHDRAIGFAVYLDEIY